VSNATSYVRVGKRQRGGVCSVREASTYGPRGTIKKKQLQTLMKGKFSETGLPQELEAALKSFGWLLLEILRPEQKAKQTVLSRGSWKMLSGKTRDSEWGLVEKKKKDKRSD